MNLLQPVVETLHAVLAGAVPVDLHYQPIVDLARGTVIGYEALARFPGSCGMTPDKWFHIAAQSDLRLELEHVTVSAALRATRLLPPNCFLSLNVGPAFLLSDDWDDLLASRSHLGGVIVEITEDESITDYRRIRAKLEAIRRLGGFVAIDDAGAGYASLKHVMELAPNFIKLDRAFVTNCHRDRARAALIEMVGRTASQLDAWIIAEGVETAHELDELLRLEVPLAQGYYLARPSPEILALPLAQSRMIRARSHALSAAHSLSRIIEPVGTFQNRGVAMEVLSDPTGPDLVMIIDRWQRPAEIVERHPLLGLRTLPLFMKVQRDSDLAEVLVRALTREAPLRFDPIAAIDEFGHFHGLLRVDRLMRESLDTTAARQSGGHSASVLSPNRI